MFRPWKVVFLAMMLGGLVRVEASPMKLYVWGEVSQNFGGFPIMNQEFDVSDGFPGLTLNRSTPITFSNSFWGPGDDWYKPFKFDGGVTIGVSLYDVHDANEQLLVSGYLRGAVAGELAHPGFSSNLGGGATAEATLDLDSLYYSTLNPWTGETIPSTIDRVPSWFYDLKATLTSEMTGGVRNIYDATLTIPAVAATAPEPTVPEPGSVVVFLAAAGGGALVVRRRGRVARSLST